MYGDFSRGHRPDRRRGRAYQRVLLQQGRTLLDSDFNALADAGEQRLRELAMDLGLDAGSLDSGFLITSGVLLARFDTLAHVTPTGGLPIRKDHRRLLGGRLPALVLDATWNTGSVSIALNRPLAGLRKLRIWARTSGALRVDVGLGMQPLPVGANPERYVAYEVEVPANPSPTLTLGFEESGLGRQAWIALVEGVLPASEVAPFFVSRGRYRLGGLAVELPEAGAWPEISFPAAKGFVHTRPTVGRYVAYVEAWERHITSVEDAGLREPALGGTQDTCTRVEAVGQVKLARLQVAPDTFTPAALRAAFTAASTSSAQLTLTGTDYSGTEGRLYRFEVHRGGTLGDVVLKWSRHNGAELHPILSVSPVRDTVVLPLDADVRNGDLIEVLSETVDLGDSGDAAVSSSPVTFTPSTRTVGTLFYVREAANPEMGRRFELRDVRTRLSTQLDATVAGQPGLKVRRWHGVLGLTGPIMLQQEVEAGIRLTLQGGPFRPGEYWQYEARRGVLFSSGEWKSSAHGPERTFSPLAVLDLQSLTEPAEVLQWVDSGVTLERTSADQVSFDGASSSTDVSTVQGALEELYALARHGCMAFLEPGLEGEDDGVRLMQLIQTRLLNGGVVCLGRGIFRLRTTVDVMRTVELRASEGTVLVADVPGGPGLSVALGGQLTLSGLTVVAGSDCGPALTTVSSEAKALSLHGCSLVHAQGMNGGIAVHASFEEPRLPRREGREELEWEDFYATGPAIELRDCSVAAGWGVVAESLEALSLHGSTMLCSLGGGAVTDVGLLEVVDTAVDTGLEQGLLQALALSPPQVVAETLEQFLASRQLEPRAGGVALRASRVGRGSVEDSILAADMGLWLGAGANLRLSRNRYLAGDTAVRVDRLTDGVLEAEDVAAGLLGVHIPVGATGLWLSGCRVRAERAVVLGGAYLTSLTPQQHVDFPPPSLVSLRDVRVSTCTLEGTETALHLGPYTYAEDEPPAVELWNVEAASNLLRGTTPQAAGLSAVVPFPGGTSPAVRIVGNQLEAPQVAVWLTGGGVELSSNRIYTDGPGTLDEALPTGAVLLVGAGLLWVEGNQVELAGTGCGLCVRGGQDVRVARNTFLGPEASRPLWAVDTQRLEVLENELRSGRGLLARIVGLDVRSNYVGSGLVIRSSADGLITCNRVDGTEGFSLSIELARGRWQVSGNMALGGLRVLPRGLSTLLEDINGVAAELPNLGVVGLNGPLRPPWLSRTPSPGTPAGWVGDLVERLQGVLSQLVTYGSSLGRVVSGLTEVEEQVQLLVQGNWARDVQVGSVNPEDAGQAELSDLPVAGPHGQSVVQVLGNRAEARLVVNHYERCLVTSNVGPRLFLGSGRADRILEPNLRLG